MMEGTPAVKDLAHASSLCGACADACPVRIDIPRMLIELRREVNVRGIAPRSERIVFKALARLLRLPTLYRLAARIGRAAQRPFVSDGRVRPLPASVG